MPIIILAVLVIAAWIDLARRINDTRRQGAHLMSEQDDILAAQQQTLTSLATAHDELVVLLQAATQDPAKTHQALALATQIRDTAKALADQAAPPAPAPPPPAPTA